MVTLKSPYEWSYGHLTVKKEVFSLQLSYCSTDLSYTLCTYKGWQKGTFLFYGYLKSQYEWSYGHLAVKLWSNYSPAIVLFSWPQLNFANLLNMKIGTFLFSFPPWEFQYKYSHGHLEVKMRVFSSQPTYCSMTSVQLDTLIKLKEDF